MKDKVRMNISREMHEWFTGIKGKTNDERMAKLKAYKEKGDELNKAYMARGQAIVSTMQTSHKYQELYYRARNNSRILAGWLTVAITANFGFLVYVALTNGWLL